MDPGPELRGPAGLRLVPAELDGTALALLSRIEGAPEPTLRAWRVVEPGTDPGFGFAPGDCLLVDAAATAAREPDEASSAEPGRAGGAPGTVEEDCVLVARLRRATGPSGEEPASAPSVPTSGPAEGPNPEIAGAGRLIFHVDLDAFFVAVERVLDPRLEGLPVVVGGSPDGRGVVAAASYEARAFGVRSAMPMATALRLCPQLVRVRGSREMYGRASRAVFAILERETTRLEKVSVDEGYLDLSERGLDRGAACALAIRLQREIRERLRLDASFGIASNRLLAKVASDLSKPRGVLECLPGQEQRFLAPLPVRSLPGIGPKTTERLQALRIQTLGQLVARPPEHLLPVLGRHAERLQARARGEDARPVRDRSERPPPKSISHERTFPRDRSDAAWLLGRLAELLEKGRERMRERGLLARTVSLKLRDRDFRTVSRELTLATATDDFGRLRAALDRLYEEAHDGRTPLRLVGVKLSGFQRGFRQLELFPPPEVGIPGPPGDVSQRGRRP